MNLHEYQAKQLFNRYGIATPHGDVADDAESAMHIIKRLAGDRWVVKAQVHSGGRGKAGGVKVVNSEAEAVQTAKKLIGTSLVTQQTTALGLPVKKVLIEQP
ncbi:MAG: ATP-grasp domain-containing protein, partial [Methylophaga sp.]